MKNDTILSRFEGYLNDLRYPAEPSKLYEPIGYSLRQSGKRLRPVLLLLACEAFGSDASRVMPAAAAVEVFHNFTLLHDDIMDNAAVRRGAPSVFAKWGQNVAILSGDAMIISAYQQLAKLPAERQPWVLERFNRMALEVCEGQQYDMDFETRDTVTVEEYMQMIGLKTAALLSGSLAIGAYIAGASMSECEQLERFGMALGQAFQLQDDWLDSYGDEQLGKKIGGDILEGKKTYLMVTAYRRATPDEQRVLRETSTNVTLADTEKIAAVKTIYDRYDIPDVTQHQINIRFKEACGFIPGSRFESLRDYAASLIGRNR